MKIKSLLLFILILPLACSERKGPDDQAGFTQGILTTSDGVILANSFKAPASPEKLTFILIHGLGSDKSEWDGFAKKLSERGYGYLSVDLRGHGGSGNTISGKQISYRTMSRAEWSAVRDDIRRISEFLVKEKNIPLDKIALCGASIGANLSIIYASNEKQIPLVILLSPGLQYLDYISDKPMQEYGDRPVLIAAAPNDQYAYQSSEALIKLSVNADSVFLKGTAGHGVQMFDGSFEEKIIDWIDKAGSKE